MYVMVRAGDGLIHLDTFIRRNVAAAAQLAETCDMGHTFSILAGDGFPDELDVQDPIYVTCLRHIVLGSVSLEPILVSPCSCTRVGLQSQSFALHLLMLYLKSTGCVDVTFSSGSFSGSKLLPVYGLVLLTLHLE
jgi:hypothetical protein